MVPILQTPTGPVPALESLSVTVFADGTVRLRADAPEPSLTEEFGLLQIPPPVPTRRERDGDRNVWNAAGTCVVVQPDTGRVEVSGTDWQMEMTVRSTAPGADLRVTLEPDDALFGLGFQRRSLDLRGHALPWRRAYRSADATVPFLFSTAGWGLYSNGTWAHHFDCGAADPRELRVTAEGGGLDVFVFPGPTPRDILARYTALTGRAQLPPKWALGLDYIARYFETQDGLCEIARRFRAEGIPCAMLGLEPGWEKHPYSMGWEWCPDRFPDPAALLRALTAEGFRLGLWESGDAPAEEYTDATQREAWYARRRSAALENGVAFFKQDDPYPRMIHSTEMNDAEFRAGLGGSEGRPAAEVAELSNTLYAHTAHAAFERFSGGERTFTIFYAYMTGPCAHRLPLPWAGDFPNGPGMLSAGLSGHSMAAIDMKADSPGGIHFGYLTPFPLIDSWAFYQEPWLLPPPLHEAHRHYARLRQRLWPYLYTTLWQALESGLPMMRAMALDAPHDRDCRALTSQHFLGDAFLVGQSGSTDGAADGERFAAEVRGSRVWVPAGTWWNYWTGRSLISSGDWHDVDFAPPACGPLLVRDGAVIPLGRLAPAPTDEPVALLQWDIFPGARPTEGRFVNDDGRAHPEKRGTRAEWRAVCQPEPGRITITLEPAAGDYPGRPEVVPLVTVHLAARPKSVSGGNWQSTVTDDFPALLRDPHAVGAAWCAASRTLWIKPLPNWTLRRPEQNADCLYDELCVHGPGALLAGRLTLTVVPGEDALSEGADADCPAVPTEPDDFVLTLNPPERVALEGGGWLPRKTTAWVTLRSGGRWLPRAGVPVRLVVSRPGVPDLDVSAATDAQGCATFAGLDYQEDVTRFQARVAGLPSREAVVRAAPGIRGLLR